MIRNIQALRAIAAMLVVVAHFQPLLMQAHPALQWVGLGRAGVDLFFVISGFIMVYTTERDPVGPKTFALRRIQRIVPLYWAVTLALFALALAAPSLLGASRPDPVWLVKSLLFIPFDKGDGTANPLVPVGWTLNYEMFFYAVFALALFLRSGRGRYLAVVGVIGALGLVGLVAEFSQLHLQFYTRPILLEFAAGVLIALAYDRLPRVGRGPAAAGVLAFAIAMLVVLAASGLAAADERLRVALAMAGAVGLVLAAIVLERGGAAAHARPVLELGHASYAIYLTHMFVSQAVILALRFGGLGGPTVGLLAALSGIVACALVGLAVHHLFERPVDRTIRRLTGRPAVAKMSPSL
ncbi:acyltransferase family protein [Phenylobacterium deserti]|uniref:Acyltransferase n=1 Tax=Phenylobacterium deserti TaxID=1914756 RepID=A0A328AS42_9CAUL|nr:acyltransferase [Phenylobacterium deserti]RAK57135.1 acyltransferase [Phenylobacterium deserti]